MILYLINNEKILQMKMPILYEQHLHYNIGEHGYFNDGYKQSTTTATRRE